MQADGTQGGADKQHEPERRRARGTAWGLLLPHLDFSITSQEVGAEKPDPLIFERALQRADAQPESAVHVGDQITSDVAGAVNVGINAVLLDRDRQSQEDTRHSRALPS